MPHDEGLDRGDLGPRRHAGDEPSDRGGGRGETIEEILAEYKALVRADGASRTANRQFALRLEQAGFEGGADNIRAALDEAFLSVTNESSDPTGGDGSGRTAQDIQDDLIAAGQANAGGDGTLPPDFGPGSQRETFFNDLSEEQSGRRNIFSQFVENTFPDAPGFVREAQQSQFNPFNQQFLLNLALGDIGSDVNFQEFIGGRNAPGPSDIQDLLSRAQSDIFGGGTLDLKTAGGSFRQGIIDDPNNLLRFAQGATALPRGNPFRRAQQNLVGRRLTGAIGENPNGLDLFNNFVNSGFSGFR